MRARINECCIKFIQYCTAEERLYICVETIFLPIRKQILAQDFISSHKRFRVAWHRRTQHQIVKGSERWLSV